jgi:arylsulfatase
LIRPGQVSDAPLYFPDVLPTLCELTGADVPKGLDGVSFLPTLLGRPGQAAHELLYWEFPSYGGQQAVQAGEWKAVRQNLAQGQVKTELYHLKDDPSEASDVAGRHPEVVRRLEALLREHHTPSADFPLPAIDPKGK